MFGAYLTLSDPQNIGLWVKFLLFAWHHFTDPAAPLARLGQGPLDRQYFYPYLETFGNQGDHEIEPTVAYQAQGYIKVSSNELYPLSLPRF